MEPIDILETYLGDCDEKFWERANYEFNKVLFSTLVCGIEKTEVSSRAHLMNSAELFRKLERLLSELWKVYFRCVQENGSDQPYINERTAIENFQRQLSEIASRYRENTD